MKKLGTTEKLIIYILTKKQKVHTKEIVDLLSLADRSESAARATLHRLKQKGFIDSERKGRETLFSLASQAQQWTNSIMSKLKRSQKRWDRTWLLLSFQIPEKLRHLRNQLREELRSLGLGRLHTNLWISPYNLRSQCEEICTRLGIRQYIVMFLVNKIDGDPEELAAEAWPLKEVAQAYRALIQKLSKRHQEAKRQRFHDPMEAAIKSVLEIIKVKEEIVGRIEREPFLPPDLLPKDWPGPELRKVITEYLALLYKRASALEKYAYLTNRNQEKA